MQSPPDKYLSVIFSVFVRDGRDNRVVKRALPRLDVRTVCLYDDLRSLVDGTEEADAGEESRNESSGQPGGITGGLT